MKSMSSITLRGTLVLLFMMSLMTSVHAFDYPKDTPTIEALIDLHKRVKKIEERPGRGHEEIQ